MASRRRIPKVANIRYFEQYKLNRFVTQSQTPHNQAWWPEGSDPGGANASGPPNHVEPSGEGERLSRKRSPSTSSAELRDDNTSSKQGIPLDRRTASHDAQLQRLKNAQASKRSRTRLKTMKVLPVEWYTLFLCVIFLMFD
ncbi:hypothetical protein E4U37_001571 [Claviceps purpurea]|nr:hypothetical protein E4U37_001571 [Claviceps purpurea]